MDVLRRIKNRIEAIKNLNAFLTYWKTQVKMKTILTQIPEKKP